MNIKDKVILGVLVVGTTATLGWGIRLYGKIQYSKGASSAYKEATGLLKEFDDMILSKMNVNVDDLFKMN